MRIRSFSNSLIELSLLSLRILMKIRMRSHLTSSFYQWNKILRSGIKYSWLIKRRFKHHCWLSRIIQITKKDLTTSKIKKWLIKWPMFLTKLKGWFCSRIIISQLWHWRIRVIFIVRLMKYLLSWLSRYWESCCRKKTKLEMIRY